MIGSLVNPYCIYVTVESDFLHFEENSCYSVEKVAGSWTELSAAGEIEQWFWGKNTVSFCFIQYWSMKK